MSASDGAGGAQKTPERKGDMALLFSKVGLAGRGGEVAAGRERGGAGPCLTGTLPACAFGGPCVHRVSRDGPSTTSR